MPTISILHNPRCSKSRQTLALLQEQGINPTIIEYLKTPLDEAAIRDIASKLGLARVTDMMRTKEADFKEAGLHLDGVTDDQRFRAMASFPKLIERPVVINGDKAKIGRPPEAVLDIL